MSAETAEMTAEEACQEAGRLRLAGATDAAIELLQRLIDGGYGPLSPQLRWATLSNALKSLSLQGRWQELRDTADRTVAEFPGNARGWRYCGEALHHLGEPDLAADRLQRALALAPGDIEIRALLRIVSDRSEPPPRPPVRPWPTGMKAFRDPRQTIRRYLLRGHDDPKFITPDTAFVTMGSCFARELAGRLTEAGRKVHYEGIGESVNSTFANRRLLDWLEHGPVDAAGEAVEIGYGPHVRTRLAGAIAEADVVILTLGVAPCFFHHQTGEFAIVPRDSQLTGKAYIDSHYVMRTTSVAENTENLVAIVESLKRLARKPLRIVLTVSPVPLQGTTEMDSAIEADCLSKSTLRVACAEALRHPALADAVYWPSFEMVRWLGPYWDADHPTFGAEDTSPFHVSNWLVEMIVQAFLEHFAA